MKCDKKPLYRQKNTTTRIYPCDHHLDIIHYMKI